MRANKAVRGWHSDDDAAIAQKNEDKSWAWKRIIVISEKIIKL